MKNFLITLAVVCAGMLSVLQAQTISSIAPNNGVRGQALTVSIIGTGTNFSTATNTFLEYSGNILYPVSWQSLSNTQITATYSIPPNSILGPWDVVVAGQFQPVVLPLGFFIGTGMPNGSYGQVRGTTYKDANLNCSLNVGEERHSNQAVTILPGPHYALTDNAGNYQLWLPVGSYTADFSAPFPYTNTCPASGQRSFTLSTNGQILFNEHFATDHVMYSDARIIGSGLPLRPGFMSTQYLLVRNVGNQTIPNAVVKFVKPAFASFGATTPPAAYINGDTASWNIVNLLTSQTLQCSLYCPVNIPIGTSYSIAGSITPSPMDLVTTNNSFLTERVVVGAWDPNDKQVFTSTGQNADGDVTADDSLLTYIVRFQNTGTDTAFNIFVRDTLDESRLDLGTLRILGASHPYTVTMSSGGQLEFYFANILLPDSGANQAGSNGFFTYQIETRPSLPLGTVIQNSASIYFDFNAPVKTNTVHTRLCDPLTAAYASSVTGLTAQFTNQSVGAGQSWLWDFGDGNTSTQQSPSHTYATGGNYQICLITTGICRADTSCTSISVCNDPVAAFTTNSVGLNASFTDASTNSVTYAWDFGDGGTSTLASPTHAYTAIGTYQVCLTTTGACGTVDTECTSIFVCVAPTASWNFSQPSAGTLAFTDGSQFATAWNWTFGNGAGSSLQNPTHTYTANGSYTICLITTNACGEDTSCVTTTVCPAQVQAAFSSSPNQYLYTFTDQSLNAVAYAWDFGDGGSSTLASPTHTYAANGTYNVCQTVTDLCGTTNMVCHTVAVQVVGIAEALPGFAITVMPNPMSQQAVVWVQYAEAGPYAFEMYDLRGALVRKLDGQLNERLTVERAGLAQGMYTFRIMQEGVQIGNGRIVIER